MVAKGERYKYWLKSRVPSVRLTALHEWIKLLTFGAARTQERGGTLWRIMHARTQTFPELSTVVSCLFTT